MLSLKRNSKIYFFHKPVDLRKGFDSLAAIVINEWNVEMNFGNYFLFWNVTKNRLKVFYWDNNGMAVWCKRAEYGTFVSTVSENTIFGRKGFRNFLKRIAVKQRKRRYSLE